MENLATAAPDDVINERVLSKLKWRSRRGLLENDIFVDRFFKRYESLITVKQAQGLMALMELSDNDLLDLHLGRKTLAQVQPDLDRDDVSEVLTMLRANPKGQNETS
ncbi:MAG: succinate dehydrogenase assembly factor 2 [Rhodoferax ferrireducens]|uniref:FAD assembly factor SdhE n=1 Tax=Rhodoferax ferrireducens TaxID=192843 RepID=A0A1W9KYK7_9BURK|nr:MAG: succinate dehydrogenase assembly factor 2 [Rhodoferax ferrireducens]